MTAGAPARADAPYVDSHGNADLVWVDMLYVPRAQRGQGIGRKTYEAWEASLPTTVRLVLIHAGDTGSGDSSGFWDAMGFAFRYDGENLSHEARCAMAKGVNGHPTPPTLRVEDGDEDEEE